MTTAYNPRPTWTAEDDLRNAVAEFRGAKIRVSRYLIEVDAFDRTTYDRLRLDADVAALQMARHAETLLR